MENIKDLYKDLPQLIVALDSLNDDANYIHINDAKDGVVYYCPCCKGIIKPRAYKDDKEYQVQAHFYHENDSCNDEDFVHYICKTWLFEVGSKFKIGNEIYTVENIETEKTHHTIFGDYRPDITVHTTCGKTFFFEVRNTNKKTENYIPKWDELGIDVVEVDVRYFINQKVDNDIPEFNLIYSDGECFIKIYSRKDYDETIALRKLEWRRQDKLNYKIMWEKLDWFWIELQDFKNNDTSPDKLLHAFESLSIYDIEDCWNILSKMSCCKAIKDECRNIINNKSLDICEQFLKDARSKYKGILEEIIIDCKPRNNLVLKFCFANNYNFHIRSHLKYDTIERENRSWIISPSKVLTLFDDFKDKETLIYNHCKNVEEINNYFTWYKTPMLYDNNVFDTYLGGSDFKYYPSSIYIKNSRKVIDKINNKIINELSKIYITKFCMGKYEIMRFIDTYLKEFRLIYKVLEKVDNSMGYGYTYKGNKIIWFNISDTEIIYKGKTHVYELARKLTTQTFLKECINESINDFNLSVKAIDMISDINRYSNKTWEFNLDIPNKSMIITFNYTVPYYEQFTKRLSSTTSVNLSEMFCEDFHFINYCEEVTLLLNTKIAPAMLELINGVVDNYNSNNLTSAICKTSDIKHITRI